MGSSEPSPSIPTFTTTAATPESTTSSQLPSTTVPGYTLEDADPLRNGSLETELERPSDEVGRETARPDPPVSEEVCRVAARLINRCRFTHYPNEAT
jgi:hypothetical protein